MSVLFVGKRNHALCAKASTLLLESDPRTVVVMGVRGEPAPAEFESWDGDYIVSYLSPWIVPERLLKRARRAAINFHPGPPEYPGIGCTNFALYNNETSYGVTCHHMALEVDTGAIIAVRRFAVSPEDTVHALTEKSYEAIDQLFRDLLPRLLSRAPLPETTDRWTRRPFTRAELNALCRVTPDMSADEIERRIRAVTFPGAGGAYVVIGGRRFVLEPAPVNTD
jgi:methionyl-tRNA formyltransferase